MLLFVLRANKKKKQREKSKREKEKQAVEFGESRLLIPLPFVISNDIFVNAQTETSGTKAHVDVYGRQQDSV